MNELSVALNSSRFENAFALIFSQIFHAEAIS